MDPRLGPGFDGRMGGNLMGPNHPMFAGRGGFDPALSGLPVGGPGTMQPRFDPIHPGVVYDPDGRGLQPLGPGRRRLGGNPNPDHLPPPNSFGQDMFS